MREYSEVASCGCVDDNGQVFPCDAHQVYGSSPMAEDRIPASPQPVEPQE